MSLGLLIAVAACGSQAPLANAPPTPAPELAAAGASSSTASAGSKSDPPPLPSDSETKASAAAPAAAPALPPESTAAELPQGSLVLHIGDSFADALGGSLGKLLKAAGVKNELEFKTPSYIPNWSYGPELPRFLARHPPDLVLITLGANEIEIPHPEDRKKPIQHLVSLLGGRPCVWITPPLWKPDSGVLQVIRENVAPCRYLDSDLLVHDLPRARDKIHPSLVGRDIWAKAVFDWLVRERAGSATQPWALKPEAETPAPSPNQ